MVKIDNVNMVDQLGATSKVGCGGSGSGGSGSGGSGSGSGGTTFTSAPKTGGKSVELNEGFEPANINYRLIATAEPTIDHLGNPTGKITSVTLDLTVAYKQTISEDEDNNIVTTYTRYAANGGGSNTDNSSSGSFNVDITIHMNKCTIKGEEDPVYEITQKTFHIYCGYEVTATSTSVSIRETGYECNVAL